MGAKKQTIGYHYLMSILCGLFRGPVNEIIEIKVGDKTAWTGSVTNDAMQTINRPDLFGGEKKEGGIQGAFRVFMGAKTQVLPGAANYNLGKPVGSGTLGDVQSAIGGLVSEFRGAVTFWFDGIVTSINPYPKEWKFRARRSTSGWFNNDPWYPAKAKITLASGMIHAMNPAHIIYECVTNPEWGRGLPASEINESSFIYSANTFCDEAFGLCIIWYRKEEIESFIQTVLDHCGAVLYTDRETGLLTLRPIRADYDVADLPVFGPDSGLLDIVDDDSGSQTDNYNEVIVTAHDPITNKDFEMRANNTAAWQENGAANSLAVSYKGLPTPELAGRVAGRELKVHTSGLKNFKVILDRRGWRIAPGSCFVVQSPKRGIGSIVLRAGEIADGTLVDGKITIKAVEDVFAMPNTSLITPVESSWSPPASEAAPASALKLTEASYRDVYLDQGQTEAEGMTDTDALIMQLAAAPNATTTEYDLWTKAEGEADYEERKQGFFTGTALLADDLGPLDTTFVVASDIDFDANNVNQAIMVDDELMLLTAFDGTTKTATVQRGTGDTVPAPHTAGARLWTVDDDGVSDERLYGAGETVYTKVLSRTSSDRLTLAEATEQSIELVGRQARPYPPGDFKIDGDYGVLFTGPGHPDSAEHTEPVLTWAHRDRILQADQLIPHEAASVGPETGTTYTVQVYDGADGTTLLRTESDIDATTWTYTSVMQGEDGDPPNVYIELESSREGLASWQKYRAYVLLTSGYGYGYGLNYGGLTA